MYMRLVPCSMLRTTLISEHPEPGQSLRHTRTCLHAAPITKMFVKRLLGVCGFGRVCVRACVPAICLSRPCRHGRKFAVGVFFGVFFALRAHTLGVYILFVYTHTYFTIDWRPIKTVHILLHTVCQRRCPLEAHYFHQTNVSSSPSSAPIKSIE